MIQKSIELIHLHPKNYDSGAYGLVVFNQESNTAIKVFKNDKKIKHIYDVFNAEVEAYEIAMKNEEIACLVPKFYGKVKIDKIEGGKEPFLQDCAYQIEYIYGVFIPINNDNVSSFEQQRIKRIFSKYGINYIKDSAVVLNDSGEIIKVIDFATKEIEQVV